jgi:Protein of unknown function (DUF3551)
MRPERCREPEQLSLYEYFYIASASAAHHLDDWSIQLLEANHENRFDDRDGRSGRVVRSCRRRNARSGKGGGGRYCLSYDEGGTDCSFTSYAQCLATASGIDAECYGDTFRNDEASRNRGWAGEYQTPGF